MLQVNWFAILIASIAAYSLGALWYHSSVFGKSWKKEMNIPDTATSVGHTAKVYALSYLMTLVYCFMLARIMIMSDFSGMADGLKMGFMIGLCIAAMSLGIIYVFGNRSSKLFYIDAGYLVVASTLMGTIVGAIHN